MPLLQILMFGQNILFNSCLRA
uniref:Uncharacterized protein n=1 Tax=Anguilla anguilla TaxID=7936 RepID=A0A0E9VB60_ANGAN